MPHFLLWKATLKTRLLVAHTKNRRKHSRVPMPAPCQMPVRAADCPCLRHECPQLRMQRSAPSWPCHTAYTTVHSCPRLPPWAPRLPAPGWPQLAVTATSHTSKCAGTGPACKPQPTQATSATRPSAKSPHEKAQHKIIFCWPGTAGHHFHAAIHASLRAGLAPERHGVLAQTVFAPLLHDRRFQQAVQHVARAGHQPTFHLTDCPHTTLN